MHKSLYLFFFLTLIFAGCKEDQKEPVEVKPNHSFDTTDIKGEPLNTDDLEEVTFLYAPKKGDEFVYRLTSITKSDDKIIADTTLGQKVTETITYIVKTTVNEVENDGAMDVKFSIESVKVQAESGDKKILFETGVPTDSANRERFLEYEALIRNPFNARISNKGEIIELYRVDKIIDKVLELRKVKDSISAVEKQNFTQSIVEGGLRPTVQQIFKKFSGNKIHIDSSWSVEQPFLNLQLFGFDFNSIYKYASAEKYNDEKIAVFDISLKSKLRVSDEVKKAGYTINKATITGTGKGYFNLDKGMFQKVKSSVILESDISGSAPTPKGIQKLRSTRSTKTTNLVELISSN